MAHLSRAEGAAMLACWYCAGKVEQQDFAAMEYTEAIVKILPMVLIALSGIAADPSTEDAEFQDDERFFRNGAGMARAMHDAAHGDYGMANDLEPLVEEWIHRAMAMVNRVRQVPGAFEVATATLPDAGDVVRLMIDSLSWDASGEVVFPE